MLAGALQKLAGAVDRQKDPDTGKPRSWWRWLVVGVLVVVGVGLIAWTWRLAGRERRELARLRHEKTRLEVEKANAAAAAEAAREFEKVVSAKARVRGSEERVAKIDAEIAALEVRHAEALDAISRIRLSDLPRGE